MAGIPTRKQLVRGLRKYTPSTMERTIAYIARNDENPVNAVSWVSFMSSGARRELDAIANALECVPTWQEDLGGALAYQLLADKLAFFWHRQFRVVFANHPQPLRLMDWERMTFSMGLAFMIGWPALARYQGCLAIATLNQGFNLASGYDERHRRGHAFMLRLFAGWHGERVAHRFPAWAGSVPVYEQLLLDWRNPDTSAIEPLLLQACDHHLEQGVLDRKGSYRDFGDHRMTLVPVEILMLLRLREIEGLPVPVPGHPLMEAPFETLPRPIPPPAPDAYMLGTLKRVVEDWPDAEVQSALEVIRGLARFS